MGHIPHNMTEQELGDLLLPYVENENNKVNILTYHEDFIIGLVQKTSGVDKSEIRLATIKDLPYIEKITDKTWIYFCKKTFLFLR